MSKNLTINTSKPQKWSPSPGLDIREEDEAPQKGFIEEDDDEEEEEEEEGSDFSSSPSIPDENINFDLVYTLHTFEATVDGQASVKKGDALTLLDDSNSYWWLIKDLKTSEVGYIPAENIETPFERLARLNKHRNVEITSLNHAAHYINNKKRTPSKKKVIMSPSVHVQLEIILTGEEGENKTEETTYETWDEDMIDHDDQDDGNQVKSDHEDENTEEEEQEAAKDDSLPHTSTEDNLSSKVLRVHAGNISVGASYHSIRVTENISTAELLSKAMEKFHIPQIDHHHKRTVSSVEYYLSVRNRDGEEITIGPEDKPYSIYETLNAHLTTPMPRLSEQLKLSGTLKKKKKMHDVQFLLHKRIKRTNDGGLVHIKLSLLAQKSTSEKGNPFQSWLMKKKKKVALEAERIDKMVAVHDAITISELTLIAFEKFHIVPHKSQKYRLLLHTKSRDVLLNNNLILSDVLRELSNNEEKQFVLHNFSSTQTTPHNNNKVCPETKQPIQVTMAVDRATQTILKRVDIALSEHSHQTPTEDGKFTMSVSRNDQNGIDIHLPHGLLRSSCLGQNRTQYSLLTSPTSNKLILQKVLPAIKGQQDESNGIISAEEMEALVRYASHYLDNLENKYSHRLSITNGREIDFSNMSDLEKELQKIIMLHSA